VIANLPSLPDPARLSMLPARSMDGRVRHGRDVTARPCC
jgi:hypothetical protein